MFSAQLLLALASAGQSFVAPDPDAPMDLSDLHISTESAGACALTPPFIPTTDAQVAVTFRVQNKRLADYTVNVYLDIDGVASLFPLGTDPGFNPTGYAPIDWELNYLTNVDAKGIFTVRGYVEQTDDFTPFNPTTMRWSFRVELVENASGKVVRRLSAPWSKTYGTCE